MNTNGSKRRDPVADQILYGVAQGALILGISTRLCWAFIQRGELRTRRIGTRVLVHRRELEKFALRDHATQSKKEDQSR